MKHVVLICTMFLMALPAWADWGLSNVVKKEIHRTGIPAAAPAAAPSPEAAPAAGATAQPAEAPSQAPAQAQEIPFTKTVHYPYTIHLSSSQDINQTRKQIELIQRRLVEMVFITKINLGAPGTWYRIDYGAFSNIKDAVLRLQELKNKGVVARDAFVGGTVPYAIELGMYKTQQEAQAASRNLGKKGVVPYVVKEKDDLFRVLSGAFPDEKSAAPAMSDLMSLNLQPAIKKR
jgi:septal ring-binding cell division protein DamX